MNFGENQKSIGEAASRQSAKAESETGGNGTAIDL